MWVRKYIRDRRKGVDSPIPTQEVSNEEFIPRPQNEKQRQVEHPQLSQASHMKNGRVESLSGRVYGRSL